MNLSENTWLVSQSRQSASPTPNTLVSRLQAGLDRIGTAWISYRQRSQDIQVLQSFSDRELWDMGLSRSDIVGIAKGTYRRS